MHRLLFFLIMIPQLCLSQFHIIDIDNGFSDKSQSIAIDSNDNIWTKTRYHTGTHFTSAISKFDRELNLIHRDTFNSGLTFRDGLTIDNGILLEAGSKKDSVLLIRRNLDGDIISVHKYTTPGFRKFNAFGVEANDSHYLIATEGLKEGLDSLYTHLLWVRKADMHMDTFQYLHTGLFSRMWDLIKGDNEDFYALVDTSQYWPEIDKIYRGRRIYKINRDKSINVLFSNNELTSGLGFGDYLVRFPDGYIVFNAMHTDLGEKELFLIDSTGRYLGRSDYPYIEIRAKTMSNLELYDDRSFVACGYKQRQGWLMKGRKDMSIVWQRLFTVPFDIGSFSATHVRVLSDGSLVIMGGTIEEKDIDGSTYRNRDVLLLKLDARGCIEETILLDNYEVLYSYQTRAIDLYPNPSSGVINLGKAYEGYYQVVSAGGQTMAQGQLSSEQQLDLTTLPAGWYTLQIIDQASGELAQGSFVKQ